MYISVNGLVPLVAVMCPKKQQCLSNIRKEEDCRLENMDINNAGSTLLTYGFTCIEIS